MASLIQGGADFVDNGASPVSLPGNATGVAIGGSGAASGAPPETGRVFALTLNVYISSTGETGSQFTIASTFNGGPVGGIGVADNQTKALKALGSVEPRIVCGAGQVAGLDKIGEQVNYTELQGSGTPKLARYALLYLVLQP